MAQYLQDPVELAAHHGVLLAEFPPARRRSSSKRCWCWERRRRAGTSVEGPIYGSPADGGVGAWRAAGRAQYSDLHDRRGADGGRCHPAAGCDRWRNANVAGWVRKAAAKFNGIARETRRNGTGSRRWHLVSMAGLRVGGRGDLRAASAQEVPGGVRSAQLSGGRAGHAATAMPRTRIFTNDEWGDYLIWRLYPHTGCSSTAVAISTATTSKTSTLTS